MLVYMDDKENIEHKRRFVHKVHEKGIQAGFNKRLDWSHQLGALKRHNNGGLIGSDSDERNLFMRRY